jgi:hypothetical protein
MSVREKREWRRENGGWRMENGGEKMEERENPPMSVREKIRTCGPCDAPNGATQY